MTAPNPEADHVLNRLEISAPPHITAEIIISLGKIATTYDLPMKLLDAIEADELLVVSANRIYNPALIDWVLTEDEPTPCPVITKPRLASLETRDTRGLAERSFNAMSIATSKAPVVYDLRRFVLHQDGAMQGFRADRFSEMVDHLTQPYGLPKKLGVRSLDFLHQVREDLYISSTIDNANE